MSQLSWKIIDAWADNVARNKTEPIPARSAARVTAEGDRIMSYGWWEMARILRDKHGNPTRFLINGDTYSVTTSRQQSEVRSAIARTGLPSVIVPFSVLDEAGIVRDSIAALDVTADWTERKTIVETENPGHWAYYHGTTYDDFGGWQNTLTGEIVLRPDSWDSSNKPRVQCDHLKRPDWDVKNESYGEYTAKLEPYETHMRLRHGEWVELKSSTRQTGHKRIVSGPNGRTDWEMVADPDTGQLTYQRDTYRHWLGESLITATVRYDALAKCERHGKERCSQCPLRRVSRTRTARFLSGFDSGETRPSYFFCELPRTSKATTVQEAYDDLKPSTVKTAESIGRDVKRQGDIFAVPLATLTTADLSKLGAKRLKRGQILGTNHVATEVATIGKLTYARGTLTHAPQFRRPDHKRVALGDRKTWHLVLKNTVPVTT